MAPYELGLAVLALLLTPGPTNSLMLLAGAERGLTRAMRLIPAELAGYFLTVVPLALIGARTLADQAQLRNGLMLAAGLWVAVLALRLWRVPAMAPDAPAVHARDVFVTTALNPKALIFGLVLLPGPDRLAANLAVFGALIVLVAVIWAGIGAALRHGGERMPRAIFVLRRLASIWLAALSVLLLVRSGKA